MNHLRKQTSNSNESLFCPCWIQIVHFNYHGEKNFHCKKILEAFRHKLPLSVCMYLTEEKKFCSLKLVPPKRYLISK